MSEVSFLEQVVKRRSERHGVDDEVAVVGECEDDHFEELAIASRTDHQHLGRISLGVHVHDNQRMLDGIDHLVGSDAVPTR